jgi:hypothetical protein
MPGRFPVTWRPGGLAWPGLAREWRTDNGIILVFALTFPRVARIVPVYPIQLRVAIALQDPGRPGGIVFGGRSPLKFPVNTCNPGLSPGPGSGMVPV